ncbi:hypothetical protein AB0J21_28790 [Streptomyces sp. NPDC049954]|uniref:type IV toxin-antitoxin system AbiEi family antitoxin domain-containing protein n=1 Tax=Streptomyces sp. NPDC049954 TaxID=3155779 RepID=UPI003448C6C7
MDAVGNSRLEQRLANLPRTFTTAQARQALLSPRDLAHLVTEAVIDELSRGVYRRADAPETAHADLLAVCARAPRAVVCGESALALHELIDDIPAAVHIAVPRGTSRPTISPAETTPMYDAARSVVDAMRHRSRLGEALALSALGRHLRRSGRGGVGELQHFASELDALAVVRPAMEAVLA